MSDLAAAWDERVDRGIGALPSGVASRIAWLRAPHRRMLRIGAGMLLVLGGLLSILPILGLWMLPLGFALIAEDVPAFKAPLERAARWCERIWARIGRRRTDARDPDSRPRLEREKSPRASA